MGENYARTTQRKPANSTGSFLLGGSWVRSYKWSYKSLNMGYDYSYPNYEPTYNYP